MDVGLPNEINYDIMLRLPYETLLVMCGTNRYYTEICRDRLFWVRKMMMDYGIDISGEEDPRGAYAKHYYLNSSEDLEEAIRQGDYYRIMRIHNRYDGLHWTDNEQVAFTNDDFLRFLMRQSPDRITFHTIAYYIKNKGFTDVLKELYDVVDRLDIHDPDEDAYSFLLKTFIHTVKDDEIFDFIGKVLNGYPNSMLSFFKAVAHAPFVQSYYHFFIVFFNAIDDKLNELYIESSIAGLKDLEAKNYNQLLKYVKKTNKPQILFDLYHKPYSAEDRNKVLEYLLNKVDYEQFYKYVVYYKIIKDVNDFVLKNLSRLDIRFLKYYINKTDELPHDKISFIVDRLYDIQSEEAHLEGLMLSYDYIKELGLDNFMKFFNSKIIKIIPIYNINILINNVIDNFPCPIISSEKITILNAVLQYGINQYSPVVIFNNANERFMEFVSEEYITEDFIGIFELLMNEYLPLIDFLSKYIPSVLHLEDYQSHLDFIIKKSRLSEHYSREKLLNVLRYIYNTINPKLDKLKIYLESII